MRQLGLRGQRIVTLLRRQATRLVQNDGKVAMGFQWLAQACQGAKDAFWVCGSAWLSRGTVGVHGQAIVAHSISQRHVWSQQVLCVCVWWQSC